MLFVLKTLHILMVSSVDETHIECSSSHQVSRFKAILYVFISMNFSANNFHGSSFVELVLFFATQIFQKLISNCENNTIIKYIFIFGKSIYLFAAKCFSYKFIFVENNIFVQNVWKQLPENRHILNGIL